MKNKLYLVICFILVLTVALVACSAPPANVTPDAAPAAEKNDAIGTDMVSPNTTLKLPLIVRYLSGEVSVVRDGEKKEVKKDDYIYEGDEIKTGEDGLIILKLESSKQIHIAENTHFIVSILQLDGDSKTAEFSLEQGNVVSVINEALGANESYEIETPELIMAIRGTIVSINYDPDADCSRATFFEGNGIFSSKVNADVAEVSAGESVGISDGIMERIDVQPALLNNAEQRFLFDDTYRELLGNADAEIMSLRLEKILSTQAFIEAKKNYNETQGDASAGDENTSNDIPAEDNPQHPDDTPAVADTFSLDNAKERFSEYHPDANITVAKREGDVYYVEGRAGTIIYKMKFEVSSGKVVLDFAVETDRR